MTATYLTLDKLKPKVGDRVQFSPDTFNSSIRGLQATIITQEPESYGGGHDYLVGWKAGEPASYGRKTTTTVPPQKGATIIPNLADYTVSVWVPNHNIAIIIDTRARVSSGGSVGGMQCAGKYCGAFNEYAQANMPDGSYLCWSCKQRPACMR